MSEIGGSLREGAQQVPSNRGAWGTIKDALVRFYHWLPDPNANLPRLSERDFRDPVAIAHVIYSHRMGLGESTFGRDIVIADAHPSRFISTFGHYERDFPGLCQMTDRSLEQLEQKGVIEKALGPDNKQKLINGRPQFRVKDLESLRQLRYREKTLEELPTKAA